MHVVHLLLWGGRPSDECRGPSSSRRRTGGSMIRFPLGQAPGLLGGVCPGNKQSGGKRLSGHTTPGDGWLRVVLGEVA
jgi:transposase IS116/IS110/IS902 family protein